jgi:hypothetical protein
MEQEPSAPLKQVSKKKYVPEREVLFEELVCDGERLEAQFTYLAKQLEKSTLNFHIQLERSLLSSQSQFSLKFPSESEVDCNRLQPCSTCDPERLSVGSLLNIQSPTSKLHDWPTIQLLHAEKHGRSRFWIDAKARPMIVATPVPHVERVTGFESERERQGFFQDISEYIREHTLQTHLLRVVVNHGTCQNHPHLHVKLYLTKQGFQQVCGPEKTALLLELQTELNKVKKTEKLHRKYRPKETEK